MTTAPTSFDPFSDSPPLPSNIWAPMPGASIEIYWSDPVDGAFDVALMLIDPDTSVRDPNNLIAYRTLSADTPRLRFSLFDEIDRNCILGGQIEFRIDENGAIGLWLVDTTYPGGFTDVAQIAGPFEGGPHGDAQP